MHCISAFKSRTWMCSRAADVSELRAVGVERDALEEAVAGRPFEWLVAHVVLQSTSTICYAGLKARFATVAWQ